MTRKSDPVSSADAEARAEARALLAEARFAALAYTDATTGLPGISRIAFGLGPEGEPLTLISSLSAHTAGLRAQASCAFMVGEPGDKGDPLTHPRLMVQAEAQFVAPDDPARAALRAHYLETHPKARLYADFADFAFVRLVPRQALLNGGFGRAFRFEAADLRP